MPRKEPTGVLMPRHKKALWAAVRELEASLGNCSDRTDPYQIAERARREKLLKDAKEAMVEVRELVDAATIERRVKRGYPGSFLGFAPRQDYAGKAE